MSVPPLSGCEGWLRGKNAGKYVDKERKRDRERDNNVRINANKFKWENVV